MIVVKIGGSLFASGVDGIVKDMAAMALRGAEVVAVHGGAAEVSAVSEKLGKKPSFIVSPSGVRSRYTDRETVEIYQMVMAGKINKRLVAMLAREGAKAIGLCGIDGELIRAERKRKLLVQDERGRRRIIDGGFTGKPASVNGGLLNGLIREGYVPVVAPVAISEEYDPLNLDSDVAASAIAIELRAEALLFMTAVEGLMLDGKLIRSISVAEANELRPRIGHGMMRKVQMAVEAVSKGVPKVIIASGLAQNPVVGALNGSGGTIIHE
jgi:acetylglutamate/LysW-gamma-L-alpha-aminoadipate kinase